MADFMEEAYVLEKMEISEDDDDGFEYKEIKDSDEDPIEDVVLDSIAEDDDDLNDFNALKTKTEKKKALENTAARGKTTRMQEV